MSSLKQEAEGGAWVMVRDNVFLLVSRTFFFIFFVLNRQNYFTSNLCLERNVIEMEINDSSCNNHGYFGE